MRFPPDSCSQFHKYFMHSILVIYGSNKISCTIINCFHASMQQFTNALAYFDSTISHVDPMTILIKPLLIRTLLITLTYATYFSYNDFTFNSK
jgi:hypothetical protein